LAVGETLDEGSNINMEKLFATDLKRDFITIVLKANLLKFIENTREIIEINGRFLK